MKPRPSDDLRILCWEGYDSSTLLSSFEQRHGIAVAAETLLSDAAAVHHILNSPPDAFDVINLNNPFAQQVLYPKGIIQALDMDRFGGHLNQTPKPLAHFFDCVKSVDGDALLGVCQRFGPFNMVINTNRLSVGFAEDQGFFLPFDPALKGRYGVLLYDDFTVFHVCISAGLNPFKPLSGADLDQFSKAAEVWFSGAAIVTDDHDALNAALLRGDIDVYLGGGRYTVAHARRAGHTTLRAITPRSGPINGRGAIAFVEVTSITKKARNIALAEDFLDHILKPRSAYTMAFETGLCNPVAQFCDPAIRALASATDLNAIQWDTLEEEMHRCAPYQIAPDYSALLKRLKQALL